MRNRLIIDDTERQNILESHKQAILKEQENNASGVMPNIPNIPKSLYYQNADGSVGELKTPIQNYPSGAVAITKQKYDEIRNNPPAKNTNTPSTLPVTNNSPSSAQPVTNNSPSSTQPVKNKKVIELQNKLLEKGFDVGKTGADGIFGQATLNAAMNLIKRYEGLLSSSQSKQIQSKTATSVSPPTEPNTTSQSKTATSAPQPTNQKTPTPTENNRPLDTTPTEDSSNL